MLTTRHFVFFRQSDGTYVREWKGQVEEPEILRTRNQWPWLGRLSPLIRLADEERQAAFDEWATVVSQPRCGEIGLDVTHIGWPAGDFCYCHIDLNRPKPLLDWGPMRHFVEVNEDLRIVAIQTSHRPIHDAVPGQFVIDITGSAIEPFHGELLHAQFVKRGDAWSLKPRSDRPVRAALAEAPSNLLDEIVGELACLKNES